MAERGTRFCGPPVCSRITARRLVLNLTDSPIARKRPVFQPGYGSSGPPESSACHPLDPINPEVARFRRCGQTGRRSKSQKRKKTESKLSNHSDATLADGGVATTPRMWDSLQISRLLGATARVSPTRDKRAACACCKEKLFQDGQHQCDTILQVYLMFSNDLQTLEKISDDNDLMYRQLQNCP